MSDALKNACNLQRDENCEQVLQYREKGQRINRDLRHEIHIYARQCEQSVADAQANMKNLSTSTASWRAEATEESQLAAMVSQRWNEEAQTCRHARQLLMQCQYSEQSS